MACNASETDDQALAMLLEKACPRPSYLASSDGGPVLALALHCRMIEAGFVSDAEAGRPHGPDAGYVPHRNWNGDYMDQWVFQYTKPGKARKFTLHCSLQSRSRRMYIHATEENNQPNTCVLGLQLDNYVPSAAPLRSNSWAGVVREAAKMKALFSQYVTTPLTENAEEGTAAQQQQAAPAEDAAGPAAAAAAGPVPEQAVQAGGRAGAWSRLWGGAAGGAGSSRQYAGLVAATVAVAVIGVLLVRRTVKAPTA